MTKAPVSLVSAKIIGVPRELQPGEHAPYLLDIDWVRDDHEVPSIFYQEL
jgi:hypothetical protein